MKVRDVVAQLKRFSRRCTAITSSLQPVLTEKFGNLQNLRRPAIRNAAVALLLLPLLAQAQVTVKHVQTDKSPIATGVWAGDTYYLSGQLASPVTPADEAKGTAAVYGDTRTQAASVFAKIQKALQDQGLDMKDVVKMTVFMGPDPNTGKLDFAGMQSEFVKYFGTKEQPNKPARSAFQVAALAAPWALLEIEVIAVRGK